jgi:zinc D-Ala-D-Ala carboxypeptidase
MINDINDMLKYFNREEFACQYTGNNKIDDQFLTKLDHLRYVCGFPFIITSGYRDPSHPIEAKKKVAGTHAQGIACDIRVENGQQRYDIVKHATALGFNGIGVANSFVHVDIRKLDVGESPVMWCYN